MMDCIVNSSLSLLTSSYPASTPCPPSHVSLQADYLVRSHSVIKSKRKHIRGSHLMDEDMVSYDCT